MIERALLKREVLASSFADIRGTTQGSLFFETVPLFLPSSAAPEILERCANSKMLRLELRVVIWISGEWLGTPRALVLCFSVRTALRDSLEKSRDSEN